MTDEAKGTRLARFTRLPKPERQAALRAVLTRDGGSEHLRADLRTATSARRPFDRQEEPLEHGWQDRVLGMLRENEAALGVESETARDLLTKLLAHPQARRETLVRNSRKFHTWSFCQLLKLESQQALFRNPREGLGLAHLAAELTESAFLKAFSLSLLNDLKGSCQMYLGNARRANSEFTEAEEAFQRAHEYLLEGTGDPTEAARLLDFKATLRFKQRRLDEADRLFDQAIRIFIGVGDRHLAGVSLIGKAAAKSEGGDTLESMRLNRRALEMIESERDIRVYNIAHHNLVVDLKDLGAFRECLEEIRKLKPAHARLGDEINLIRLRSLEAELAFGLGDFENAVSVLRGVRDAFAAQHMVVDTALATLDLSVYHLKLNQTSETKRLAAESLPLFQSLGIQREAIAAWLVFQQAAEREMVTLELVKEIASYLRASRGNPELKFRG